MNDAGPTTLGEKHAGAMMGRHPEDETVRDVAMKLMMSSLEAELLDLLRKKDGLSRQEYFRQHLWAQLSELDITRLDTLKLRQKDIERIIEEARAHLKKHASSD